MQVERKRTVGYSLTSIIYVLATQLNLVVTLFIFLTLTIHLPKTGHTNLTACFNRHTLGMFHAADSR